MLTETVLHVCKGGFWDLQQHVSRIDGLLGITLSSGEVFLINICESFVDSVNSKNPTMKTEVFDAAEISSDENVAPEMSNTDFVKQRIEYETSVLASVCVASSPRTESGVEPDGNGTLSNCKLMLESLSSATNNNSIPTYDNAQEGFTAFIKVESSDDELQTPDAFIARHYIKSKFDPGDEKRQTDMFEQQTLEEATGDNSPVFGQTSAPREESGCNSRRHVSRRNSPGVLSQESIQSRNGNVGADMQSNSLVRAENSKTVLWRSAVQEFSSYNEISAWRQNYFVPRRQGGRVDHRVERKSRHDEATLQQCLEFVRTFKMSQREAERVFRIPRTTIQRNMARLYPSWDAPSCGRPRKRPL